MEVIGFPRPEEGRQHLGMGQNPNFWQEFLPRTGWKWKKLDQEGARVPRAPPLPLDWPMSVARTLVDVANKLLYLYLYPQLFLRDKRGMAAYPPCSLYSLLILSAVTQICQVADTEFSRGGHKLRRWGNNLLLVQIFQKTAWKWRILCRGVDGKRVSKICLGRSATDQWITSMQDC